MTVEEILLANLNTFTTTVQIATKEVLKKLAEFEKAKKFRKLEDLPGEIWRDVRGYEGFYKVSNFVRVKSFRGGRTKILRETKVNGYITSGLYDKNSNMKTWRNHVLVALHFIPNPENKHFVNHIDGDKTNNRVENLEWVTQQENVRHAWANGLSKAVCGAQNATAKFTEEQIKFIRENYIPYDKNFSGTALAKKFNVHSETIGKIIRRHTYKNVE